MIKQSILLITLLFSMSVFAQKVKIEGVVSDDRNEKLEFVSVSQKHTHNSTYTDSKGKYSLAVDPKDSIIIVFSSVGYQTKEYILPPLIKDIELNATIEGGHNLLDSVTIEGRQVATTTIQRVDYLVKRHASNPWNTLEAMLATMGGVSSNNELSSQYSVRGGNFDENVVYVNGMEIFRPLLVRSAQQEGLSFINPNMVNSVGFSAGGYSAEYGDRMASVLDITYKKPKKFEGLVEASLLGTDIYVGSSSGRFSQLTGIRYKTTRSLLNTTDTQAEYDPSFLDLQSYLTYILSSKWTTSLLVNYSHNTYQYTPQTRNTTFGTLSSIKSFKVYFDGWENDRFLTYQGAFNLKGKLSENLEIGFSAAAFSSNERERYDIQGQYILRELGAQESDEESVIGIGTYHNHARNSLRSDIQTISHFGNLTLDKHFVKWGLSVQREKIDDQISEWEMRDSIGYSLPQTGTSVNVFYNLRSDNKMNSVRYLGFVQDTYRFGIEQGLFVLNAGIRGSYWDFNNEFIFSPRGALAFIPEANSNFSIRIAGGLYYQAPLYREFRRIVTNENGNNIVELNKDIRSPKSVHFVLGSDYYIKGQIKPFKLTSELYYKKLTNIIPYTINNVKIRYEGENIANGYTMGLDLKLYGEFVPGADSWISFSLMKTEQNIRGAKVPLPTDQRYNIALFYQDYFPEYDRIKMSLRGLLSQGLPVSAPNKGYENGFFRTPAYKRVDIGFSWQILGEDFAIRNKNSFCKTFKNIWIGLDIFNIFDIQNTNSYYWIADAYNNQYAVPNYLTGRQVNFRVLADF